MKVKTNGSTEELNTKILLNQAEIFHLIFESWHGINGSNLNRIASSNKKIVDAK